MHVALAKQLRLYKPPPNVEDTKEQWIKEHAGKVISQVGFLESATPIARNPERFTPKRATILITKRFTLWFLSFDGHCLIYQFQEIKILFGYHFEYDDWLHVTFRFLFLFKLREIGKKNESFLF